MTRINSSDTTSESMWPKNIENKFDSARAQSCLIQRLMTTIILLTLTAGCIPTQQLQSKKYPSSEKNAISVSVNNCELTTVKENNSQVALVSQSTNFSQNSNSNQCATVDPFSQAVRFATKASNLAQSARSKQQWDRVAQEWVQAVAWMQAVPPENPRRAFAEKKVAEYMKNLAYSQQQAASANSRSSLASFNSDTLDTQLKLYLSYVATVGTPDVLIVGSSRALYGVNPQKLQQYLVAKGYPRLNIFNFGINGATAQVVDFQLRQLLNPNKLPKLIVWADGVRAFNSGRVDRTYNSIVASEGKRMLLSGDRPQLPQAWSNFASTCYQFPQPLNVFAPTPRYPIQTSVGDTMEVSYSSIQLDKYTKYSYKTRSEISPNLAPYTPYFYQISKDVAIADITHAIDANGFISIDGRFNPSYYYRRWPYVAGLYDRDYAEFYLGGNQARALNSIISYTKSRQIPLVFVNLPLSDSYLDSVRWSAEEEFHRWMQRQARENGFLFLNFNLYQPQLAKNEYFFDPSHLNRYGASAVARYIAASSAISWPR